MPGAWIVHNPSTGDYRTLDPNEVHFMPETIIAPVPVHGGSVGWIVGLALTALLVGLRFGWPHVQRE